MKNVESVRVNPAPGKVVIDMHGAQIVERVKGTPVPKIAYYNRLIKQGALCPVCVEAKKPVKTKKKATPKDN